MEFEILVNQQAGIIHNNFNQIKEQVENAVSVYKGVIVTEDTVKNAKKDIAELRKAKKEIDDARKEIKKAYLQPYNDFENQCKEILAIIDDPINLMESQTKEFEEKKRKEKHEMNVWIYQGMTEEYAEYLPVQKYYKDTWDNATTTSKTIEEDIIQLINIAEMGVSTIKAMGSEYEDIGLEAFKQSLNLFNAIQKMKDMEKQRKEILERERIKKERLSKEQEEESLKKALEEEKNRLEAEEKEKKEVAERLHFSDLLDLEEESTDDYEDAFTPDEEFIEPTEVLFDVTYKIMDITGFDIPMIEEFFNYHNIQYERVEYIGG